MSRRSDHVGEHAIRLAELAYMRAKLADRSNVDDIREWICLARGWEFKR